jgi:hypothetical protein
MGSRLGFPVVAAASGPPAARLIADEGAAGRAGFAGWIGYHDFDPPRLVGIPSIPAGTRPIPDAFDGIDCFPIGMTPNLRGFGQVSCP